VRRTDIEALGELAGEALAGGGALIREMHEGIAGRPFEILGPAAAPVRVIHDGVARAVYTGVRGGLRAAASGGARMAARGAPEDGPELGSAPRGSMALGALNGLYGNHLSGRHNGLGLQMQIRRQGRTVPPTRSGLSSAYPDCTSRIVVFVHGLCETDEAWWIMTRNRDGVRRRNYGERLQDELSFTPVYLRYNTGLRISENGRGLARLIDDLVTGWPVRIEEIVLVGHSMGGLVARSACHYAEKDGLPWTDVVRHVFCLGTPHLGADLEKGANVLGWALGKLPETRALAKVLNARSVGIKDLRYGSCVEEDWCDCDPDEFLRDRCQEVPFLPDASYYFIGATLSRGPLGSWLGDLLVRMPSASGRGNGKGRRIPFEVDNGHELTGLTHFHLLNHPAVYEQLRRWIVRRPAARARLEAAA
jgi:pimeloyl-ACP methyl ester carboxylesterase